MSQGRRRPAQTITRALFKPKMSVRKEKSTIRTKIRRRKVGIPESSLELWEEMEMALLPHRVEEDQVCSLRVDESCPNSHQKLAKSEQKHKRLANQLV